MNKTSCQAGLFDVDTEPYVVTVKQPWAWAIVHGHKDVENRSRRTHHRGLLLIQAGMSEDPRGWAFLEQMGIEPDASAQTKGAIIGSVNVVDSMEDSPSPWAFIGAKHWVLEDARVADRPIRCHGQLGLFRPPAGWEAAFDA